MTGLVLGIALAGLIFGALGAYIASYKGIDGGLGFILGALLGPIGCLIVAVLNPAQQSAPAAAGSPVTGAFVEGPMVLGNAQYRLWLVKNYKIERNEVLGEVICGQKSFKTTDDALTYAHSMHLDALNLRGPLGRAQTKGAGQAIDQQAADNVTGAFVLACILFVFIVIGLSIWAAL